jgi:hypothetical protein
MPSVLTEFPWFEADAMYLLLVRRAADLRDCNPGSAEEEERDCVWAVLEAYEAKRRKKAA